MTVPSLINLCLLLRDRFPQLEPTLETVIGSSEACKRCGSFRSRKLHLGWDNVPMHRWGQSQMFRALAFYLRETSATEQMAGPMAEDLKIRRQGWPSRDCRSERSNE
ncbi:MAG: hypothetical protein Udaeo2_20700 [Candidatus Udaeobacter sp.]|nr:MAG: hypothetical protein Udaeo2_20700 [Candidatus Udaeobacter sp.]